jgi:hypothetical protein
MNWPIRGLFDTPTNCMKLYVRWRYRTMANYEFERMRNEEHMTYFNVLTYLQGLRKTKNIAVTMAEITHLADE